MGALGRYCKLAELIIQLADFKNIDKCCCMEQFLVFQFMADEWKYSTCTQINRGKKSDSNAPVWADHYLCRALRNFLRKKREK